MNSSMMMDWCQYINTMAKSIKIKLMFAFIQYDVQNNVAAVYSDLRICLTG